MKKTIRHITMTGPRAGQTYCGARREMRQGVVYHHAGSWLDNPEKRAELCPACAAVLADAEAGQ